MNTPEDIARAHIDSQPQVRRADLRVKPPKPPKPPREPRRLTIRVSGFVWSLVGAAFVGGVGNMVLIVVAALTFGS